MVGSPPNSAESCSTYTKGSENILCLVDAVNFLFRSYYAIGPMNNAEGAPTGALYGFIRSLNKLIKELKTTRFVAIFDGPDNKKSRTAIYSEYKSHRARMPDDLVPQLEAAQQFCALAGIPSLCIPGVEADDTIGSIAKWAEAKGQNILICSSDKDLCQLVSPQVSILNPSKDGLRIQREEVKALFGVYPEQIVDLLAIMGDSSDNIPGLEGIGAKTAASLLTEFGSLDELLAHPEKLSGKKKTTFIEGAEIARIGQQLAQIQMNVDFPKEETFFHLRTPDLDALRSFYQQMHFVSLLKELPSSTAPSIKKYHLVNTPQEVENLVRKLNREPLLCIDTETTDHRPLFAKLVGIGLGAKEGEAWYIPDHAKAALQPLWENPNISWVGHNIKYDLHVLYQEGIQLSSIADDTLISSHLLSPHTQKHNLDDLLLEHFHVSKTPIEELIGKGKNQITMDQVPEEKVAAYCCADIDYTLQLHTLFSTQLKKNHLDKLLQEIELPLIPVLTKMERTGIFVDLQELHKLSTDLATTVQTLAEQIYTLAGETFNLNSPKQLSTILFDKLGIPPPKKTTTGYSTAVGVLEPLQHSFPIVQTILEYRTLEKLRSTYIDSLPNDILPRTGRIHCTFTQSVAATGRLSCHNPNLQNIPVRTESGKKIRSAFKPQLAGWSFLSADYSQIELRLLAHLSEDPILLEAFRKGEDIHTHTASIVFNVPLDAVTPKMRTQAKTVNFGILYGQQAYGLSTQLGISYHEAAEFIETYFARYKGVKTFLEENIRWARTHGKAVTMTGRQRPLPDITSPNPSLRAQAERFAINTPLQGAAADLIKKAMIAVDLLLQNKPHLGSLLLQIHDELLFESPDELIQDLAQEVKLLMETALPLKIPLVVDISIGKNWGDC